MREVRKIAPKLRVGNGVGGGAFSVFLGYVQPSEEIDRFLRLYDQLVECLHSLAHGKIFLTVYARGIFGYFFFLSLHEFLTKNELYSFN